VEALRLWRKRAGVPVGGEPYRSLCDVDDEAQHTDASVVCTQRVHTTTAGDRLAVVAWPHSANCSPARRHVSTTAPSAQTPWLWHHTYSATKTTTRALPLPA
jgi:hypothetical protein